MPELAEVYHFASKWIAALPLSIKNAKLRSSSRVFRQANPKALANALRKSTLTAGATHGKWMAFQVGSKGTLRGIMSIHLGMTGRLLCPSDSPMLKLQHGPAVKNDYIQLLLADEQGRDWCFADARLFGLVRWQPNITLEQWLEKRSTQAHELTWPEFQAILIARKGLTAKAFLLNQDICPGVGNWMADEILWQSKLPPAVKLALLSSEQRRRLWNKVRSVSKQALLRIGEKGLDPPSSWLFGHRWKPGFNCPRCKRTLSRRTIAGRTTCWCSDCQKDLA
ncbi:MAG: DNA-formamidopyrimidine glycosylase family protein [Verrucomicrobiales bacterium]